MDKNDADDWNEAVSMCDTSVVADWMTTVVPHRGVMTSILFLYNLDPSVRFIPRSIRFILPVSSLLLLLLSSSLLFECECGSPYVTMAVLLLLLVSDDDDDHHHCDNHG